MLVCTNNENTSTLVAQVLVLVVLCGVREEVEHLRLLHLVRAKVAVDGGHKLQLRGVVANLQAIAPLVALESADAQLIEIDLHRALE